MLKISKSGFAAGYILAHHHYKSSCRSNFWVPTVKKVGLRKVKKRKLPKTANLDSKAALIYQNLQQIVQSFY